jgi:hypothetical protein
LEELVKREGQSEGGKGSSSSSSSSSDDESSNEEGQGREGGIDVVCDQCGGYERVQGKGERITSQYWVGRGFRCRACKEMEGLRREVGELKGLVTQMMVGKIGEDRVGKGELGIGQGTDRAVVKEGNDQAVPVDEEREVEEVQGQEGEGVVGEEGQEQEGEEGMEDEGQERGGRQGEAGEEGGDGGGWGSRRETQGKYIGDRGQYGGGGRKEGIGRRYNDFGGEGDRGYMGSFAIRGRASRDKGWVYQMVREGDHGWLVREEGLFGSGIDIVVLHLGTNDVGDGTRMEAWELVRHLRELGHWIKYELGEGWS